MPQIRGAFPLPVSNAFEGMNRIALVSGGVFYFPSGNYVVATDANSIIEVWDPIETTWRTWITTNNSESVFCDGFNFRARNTSGSVASIAVSNAGSGMTNGIGPITGVTLSIATTGQTTANAVTPTAYAIVGGSVTAPTISQAGSGFLVPPLIVIDPPPTGGIQATATATISPTGTITAITMDNVGAGYTVSPNFWVIPQSPTYQGGPPGGPNSTLLAGAIPPSGLVHPNNAVPGNQNTSVASGVLLTPSALTGSGTLTGAVMINFGAGYTATTAPAVTVGGAAGGAAVTVVLAATVAPTLARIRSQPRVQ